MRTYIFMYLLDKDMAKVQANLGQHVGYWKSLVLDHFRNGPFGDKSGGMIIFSANSLAQAQKIISRDPLIEGEAVEQYWLKEWVA